MDKLLNHTFRCNACRGTYEDQQPDGAIYFHACPPLPPDKNGVTAERPDKRDENLSSVARQGAGTIRSEGSGVTCLSDEHIAEPAWITRMKARAAKEEELENA